MPACRGWGRIRSCAVVLMLIGFGASAVAPAAEGRRAPYRHGRYHRHGARVAPRAFASCAGLVGYARRHFAVTHGAAEPPVRSLTEPQFAPPPTGAHGAVPSQPSSPSTSSGAASSPTFSTTNNQEPGIDEPDIVKTDGQTIFSVAQGAVQAVGAGTQTPRLRGSLTLGATSYNAQLLLRGTRLIVISGAGPGAGPLAIGAPGRRGARFAIAARPGIAFPTATAPSPYFYPARTTVTEVDVSDPAAMKVARTMTVEGTFVDARQVGATARLVIASAPRAIADARLRARPGGWVPTRSFASRLTGRRYVRSVAACKTIRHPAQFSGLGMLSILTIDLDRGLYATDSKALMADAQVVYGSQRSLYVATQKWVAPTLTADQLPASPTTVIDRFDLSDPHRTTFASSGEVTGYLLNQFSLSEYRGFLRVATTSRPNWWPSGQPTAASQSYMTVLADRAGALEAVGQVGGLGAGQQIYSVRFVADAGYVVTFRQVDPLYTIDLHTPTAPRVAGQLELAGYSAYLHPVGDGLLLGVGRDVGSANEPAGTQLELFNVADPAAPRLVRRVGLGGDSASDVQFDHHAFLYWSPTHLAVLPVQIYPQIASPPATVGSPPPPPGGPQPNAGSAAQPFLGAIGFRVDGSGISEAGRISQDPIDGYPPPIRRSVVVGDRLFSISDRGVLASSLATLARQAFVAFPAVAATPGSGVGVLGAPSHG